MIKDARDSQRQKVYNWERSIIDEKLAQQLTLDECKALIQKAYDRYAPGSRFPRINGRGTTIARGSPYEISLPTWARTPSVVLHETAHALMPASYTRSGHGPEFVRMMITLWEWHTGNTYVRSAQQAKVKIAPASEVRQPVNPSKINEAITLLLSLSVQERAAVNMKVRARLLAA